MTKLDLKNGMVVELRNGEKFIVMDDRLINENGWMDLQDYNMDLCELDEEWDIMKVYGGYNISTTNIERLLEHSSCKCIYDRNGKEYILKRIEELKIALDELAGRFDND